MNAVTDLLTLPIARPYGLNLSDSLTAGQQDRTLCDFKTSEDYKKARQVKKSGSYPLAVVRKRV